MPPKGAISVEISPVDLKRLAGVGEGEVRPSTERPAQCLSILLLVDDE